MSISKFDLGPTVTISMTQDLLALLMRTVRNATCPGDEEETIALTNFAMNAEQTLAYCAEHPEDRGVVHGFSL